MSRVPSLEDIINVLVHNAPFELSQESDSRWASVAAIFRRGKTGPELLFMKRAKDERDPWSGHMAFPGGRHDPEDQSLFHTALREVQEELGLDLLEHGRLLGQLDDIQAVARGRRLALGVRPFVSELKGLPPMTPNHEVAAIVWIPLSFFVDTQNRSSFSHTIQGQEIELPRYIYEGHTIWGLTLRMLQSLLDRLPDT